jgi:uncharacterized membrane protein
VVAALGLPLIGWGLVFGAFPVIVLGIIVMLGGFYGWVFEPLAASHA